MLYTIGDVQLPKLKELRPAKKLPEGCIHGTPDGYNFPFPKNVSRVWPEQLLPEPMQRTRLELLSVLRHSSAD